MLDAFLGEPERLSTRERMDRERRWVGWRIDQRGDALTKVPVHPVTGRLAKSNEPSTWASLAEAEAAVELFGLKGVGFMLGDSWAGLDIDGPPEWKAIAPKNGDERRARRKETYERVFGGRPVGEWIAMVGGYWEFSPNLGIKGIVPGFFQKEPDEHKNGAGLEFYSGTRFFAVTGDKILDREEVDLDAFREFAACRPPRRTQQPSTPATNSGSSTAYGLRALEAEATELLRTAEGNRNNQLNISAFKLGRLVAGGEVDEGEALQALERAALGAGLGPDEIRPTLERAVADGKAEPRKAPEKPAATQAVPSSEEFEWGSLRPFTDHITGPGFPLSVLEGGKAGFSGPLARKVQVPVDLIANILLPQVSAAIHGKALIDLPVGYPEESPLRTMCPTRTGERKSTAMGFFETPLYEMEEEKAGTRRRYIAEHEAVRESVEWEIAALKKKAKDRLPELDLQKLMVKKSDLEATQPGPYRFLVSDVTPEQLAVILSANEGHGLLMLSAEAGFLKNFTTRYSTESNLDLFLKSFSGEPYTYDRRSLPAVRLRKPRLSAALLPQPILVQQLLDDDEFVHRGALPRFLLAFPASMLGTRDPEADHPMPKAEIDAWVQFIAGLVADERRTPHLVTLSEGARRVMVAWVRHLEHRLRERVSDALDGCISRLEGTSYRLLLALHVIEHGESFDVPVREETAEKAVLLASYYEGGYETALLGMSGASGVVRDARTLLWWLRGREGEVTLSDVGSSRSWPSQRIREALEELEARGYIHTRKTQTGGAPKTVIELRPEET